MNIQEMKLNNFASIQGLKLNSFTGTQELKLDNFGVSELSEDEIHIIEGGVLPLPVIVTGVVAVYATCYKVGYEIGKAIAHATA